MHYNVKLSGQTSSRETPKNLLIVADEESPAIRLHITNEAGTSLASIALDDDQILLLGHWLINVSSGGDRTDPTLTTTLDSGLFTATVAGQPTSPGTDRHGRVWRLAPSGVEHMVRPDSYTPSDTFRALAVMGRLKAGETLAYCGRVITSLPPSPTTGEARPCARCLAGEFAAE